MDLLLHLRGFVAVADELSVSEAAVELGVDQPLLSRRLRTLERELGVQLFDRSRRRIALTPDGADLLPRARQLVEQAGHLVRSVRNADRTTVTLAMPAEPDPAPLAELLGLLAEQGVTVRLAASEDGGTAPDSAAWVVDCCDPGSATWVTELGAAAAPGTAERPIRLGHLRPRRGAGGPPVLVLPHDLVAPRGDALRTAADRAGLPPATLRACPPGLAAAEVLAGRARLICGAYEARRHGLAWAPFTDPVVRGHRLTEHAPLPDGLAQGAVRRRALRLLGAALGAQPVERR